MSLGFLITEQWDVSDKSKEDAEFLLDLRERHNNYILNGGDWKLFSIAYEMQEYYKSK